MDINYLGHASFRIRTRSVSFITDPFDPKVVGLKLPKTEANIVTISHGHPDHNYLEAVKDYARVIDGPGEYEVMGVSIIGIQVYHDDKKGEERGKNTIYVYEAEGLRLCHLGDLGHKLSEKNLEDIGDIDILMIPVGGVYTIGPKEAVEVVQSIEPSIIIPMHFQKAGLNQEMFGELKGAPDFLSEMGVTAETLDKLSIKKSEIDEEGEKVIVLDVK